MKLYVKWLTLHIPLLHSGNRFFHPAPLSPRLASQPRQFPDTSVAISAFPRTGRFSSHLRCVLRPFISLSLSLSFLFRFPLHIFIRRCFLTINADHLHAGSSCGSKIPFAGRNRRATPVNSGSHPRSPRCDKPPLGIRDCLDLYACTDVGGRPWPALSVRALATRVERGIHASIEIDSPTDSKYRWWAGPVSVDGDLRARRRFGVLTLRFVEWHKSSAAWCRILSRGSSSAGRSSLFSVVFYVFSAARQGRCVLR